nr:MAG TPA: Morphogenesis protein 1 wall, phi29, hydrolase, infection [Caudoviricetes sp.]
MGVPELIGEYLVRIGADVDNNSFSAAESAFNQLIGLMKKLKGMAAVSSVVLGFAAIGKAAKDIIKDVAAADMEFTRLANQMWITKDSAKALSVAMKVMGVSQQDIAWIPELREQFFRLRNEMNELATPADADRQLRWIREIGYDIQSLQVRLKMLKEWVAYYLIKYLRPFITEFQRLVQWLNGKIGNNISGIAKKIAQFLAHIVSIGITAVKAIKTLFSTIYNYVTSMPANVKKWGTMFALAGAFILAGPFGKFIMALGGVLILLEDFMFYLKGWNSSKTLAPMWGKLLKFFDGGLLEKAGDTIRKMLSAVATLLDYIYEKAKEIIKEFIEGMDWNGIRKDWTDALHEIKEGTEDLWEALCDVFDEITGNIDEDHKMKHKSFWTFIGSCISDAVKDIARFGGKIGRIFKVVAMALNGDYAGAMRLLMQTVKSILKESPVGRFARRLFGGDEKERSQAVGKALMNAGFSKNGAAGVIGNLSAESNVSPDAVELDSYDKTGLTPSEYLNRLLSGQMSEDEFANDGVGFGIAQWTYPERKRALWEFAHSKGVPMNDLGMQTDFLIWELNQDGKLAEILRSDSTTTHQASDAVLHGYEGPQVRDASVQADRQDRADDAYDAISETAGNSFVAKPAASSSYFGSNSFVRPASYVNYNSTAGNIVVNVPGTNASPNEIAAALVNALNTRFRR